MRRRVCKIREMFVWTLATAPNRPPLLLSLPLLRQHLLLRASWLRQHRDVHT
jgi:hypothetical protein